MINALSVVSVYVLSLVVCAIQSVAEGSSSPASGNSSSIPQSGITAEILEKSLLQDWNEDGFLDVVAFGDSITRGTGDFNEVGAKIAIDTLRQPTGKAGYTTRVAKTLNMSIQNAGVSGENLAGDGVYRFIKLIKSQKPDVVILSEGANDAMQRLDPSEFALIFQVMINIASVYKTKVVLATIPPSCCMHDGRESITSSYNQEMYSLVSSNSLSLVDIHRAFTNTCGGDIKCYLLNLPEGLHPNMAGYDVMGEMVASTLLGFDILVRGSAMLYEESLNLSPGSLKTVPNL